MILSTPSLGITPTPVRGGGKGVRRDFQLPLSGSLEDIVKVAERLLRDSFNSLSRDHAPGESQ